jgi:phospho-N-acetylmuramoyl-pentapeptide-transferase
VDGDRKLKGILLSGAFAAVYAFFATPALIRFLAKKGFGQFIREDGPTTHLTKRGTPTMGGLILISATILGYVFSHLLTEISMTTSALLVIALIVGLGFVGFIDDYLKIAKKRCTGRKRKTKSIRSGHSGRCIWLCRIAISG